MGAEHYLTLTFCPTHTHTHSDVFVHTYTQYCQLWIVENSGLFKFRYAIVLYLRYNRYLTMFLNYIAYHRK